ncbi:DUF5655 domain-containing protein [Streptomyces sp. NBC_00846]|uniref:DUF5655 domain-containing protein n=1 Tax=Streptomyces sp. NBC_00846 TaxID=2975849 RepID=UPI00386F02E7|nr:DUF5655 domain-containing protein [Streptomyces sp. NBC_00846]
MARPIQYLDTTVLVGTVEVEDEDDGTARRAFVDGFILVIDNEGTAVDPGWPPGHHPDQRSRTRHDQRSPATRRPGLRREITRTGTPTAPTPRRGHVVYASLQFRAGIRAPAVGNIEYKRGVDAGVINQGLFYLSWLMDHRAEFERLVRDRLGATPASQVLWTAPRLVCIAGDFTRYDVHAVREHRRSIDLVCYRLFGNDLLGLETVASVSGGTPVARRARIQAAERAAASGQSTSLVALGRAVDDALLGLGDGVNRVQRKQYRAYQRLRNFACVCPPQRSKLLIYLKADPKEVDLVPGFTRDVTGLGHHGTGDLEVQLRTMRDVERAQDLFRASYAAA